MKKAIMGFAVVCTCAAFAAAPDANCDDDKLTVMDCVNDSSVTHADAVEAFLFGQPSRSPAVVDNLQEP